MNKAEFENLTLCEGEHIGPEMYMAVKLLYKDNVENHESKESMYDFVIRVFGKQPITAKELSEKLADEAVERNKTSMKSTNADPKEMEHMESAIRMFYNVLYENGF